MDCGRDTGVGVQEGPAPSREYYHSQQQQQQLKMGDGSEPEEVKYNVDGTGPHRHQVGHHGHSHPHGRGDRVGNPGGMYGYPSNTGASWVGASSAPTFGALRCGVICKQEEE